MKLKYRIKKYVVFSLLSSFILGSTSIYSAPSSEDIISIESGKDGEVEGLSSDAIVQSMVLSQFIAPFTNNIPNMMQSEVIKKTLPSLYEDGTGVEVTYSPLLLKSDTGYKQALLKDLFDITNPSSPKEFFVEYTYDEVTTYLDEEGEEATSTETIVDHMKVYYTNPYSLFYIGLFASGDTDIANHFKQNLHLPVDIDMYGNIVLNDSSTNRLHRQLIVPNITNPVLFDTDDYFMPTRKMLSVYQLDLLNLETHEELDDKYLQKTVGNALGDYEVGIYGNGDFVSELCSSALVSDIVDSYLYPTVKPVEHASIQTSNIIYGYDYFTKDYLNYLNSSYDGTSSDIPKLTTFVFGSSYTNIFANRFQTDNYQGDFKLIGTTGYGKSNSSVAVLPSERLYWGDTFVPKDITIKQKGLVTQTKTLPYLHFDQYTSFKGSIIDNTANWGGNNISEFEIGTILTATEDYASNFNEEVFEVLVDLSSNKEAESGSPSDAIITTPKDVYDQKVNSIVDHMEFLFTNVGTGSSTIRTSNISKEYSNINTKFDKNYMFHMDNILKDPLLKELLSSFIKYLVLFNSFLILIKLYTVAGKHESEIYDYLKRSAVCVVLSIMPVFICLLYIDVYNGLTEKMFNQSFIYWNTLETDIRSTSSQSDTDFAKKRDSYFREFNISTLDNGASIQIYDTMEEDGVSDVAISSLLNEGLSSGGSTFDEIHYNKDKYHRSVFYYFYDRYRWHLFNYYNEEITSGKITDWDNPDGMFVSKNHFSNMFSDPIFLYGQSYTDGIENNNLKSTDLMVQDILGLANMFTPKEYFEESVYEDVKSSDWFNNLYEHSRISAGYKTGNEFDYTLHPNNIIYGSVQQGQMNADAITSDLELTLDRINRNVALELIRLTDYKDCKDETLLVSAALISTFEFNKEMNKFLDSSHALIPTTMNSSGVNMDTIYKGIYLDDPVTRNQHKGDIMSAIERSGGFIAQGAVFVTSFISQICGFVFYLCVIAIVLLAMYVFIIKYCFQRNMFNKAWVGLLFFIGACLLTHVLFLAVVNAICVPAYSLTRIQLFGGYSGLVKNLMLFVAILAKTGVIILLAIFVAKNPHDLGGSIISDKAKVMFDRTMGKIKNFGKSDSNSDKVDLKTDKTSMGDDNDLDINDATSEISNGDFNINLSGGGAIAASGVELYSDDDVSMYNGTTSIYTDFSTSYTDNSLTNTDMSSTMSMSSTNMSDMSTSVSDMSAMSSVVEGDTLIGGAMSTEGGMSFGSVITQDTATMSGMSPMIGSEVVGSNTIGGSSSVGGTHGASSTSSTETDKNSNTKGATVSGTSAGSDGTAVEGVTVDVDNISVTPITTTNIESTEHEVKTYNSVKSNSFKAEANTIANNNSSSNAQSGTSKAFEELTAILSKEVSMFGTKDTDANDN